MSDPTLRTTLRSAALATFGLAALASACSSAPAETTEPTTGTRSDGGVTVPVQPSPTSTATTPTRDAGGDASDAASDATAVTVVEGGLPQKPGTLLPDASLADGSQPPTGLVCPRDSLGIDLGQLVPLGNTPSAFVMAWSQERAAATTPLLVLGLFGLVAGPVNAEIGAVSKYTTTTFAFDAPNLAQHSVPLQTDAANAKHIVVPTYQNGFAATSGDADHGVFLSSAKIDGTLDANCEKFTGGMTLTIPSSSSSQKFGRTATADGGASTIGSLLGAPNVDSDGDGIEDTWSISFVGQATVVDVLAELPH